VVDYEVDRMTGLVFDATTFRSELEVVKNERRMSVDDSTSGSLSERLYQLAYTKHSYRWPTIGSMEHLAAATIADLERFYRTYYAPNNAIVVVAGALELVPTLRELAERYGALPAQDVPPPATVPEPRQEAARQATLERSVVVPQLCLGFHSPAQHEHDFVAAQMLGEILVDGDNARLYRRLVTNDKLAASVEGALLPFAEPGLYELFIAARPGVAPDAIVGAVQEELDRLPVDLTPAEEEKVRASLELGFYDSFKNAVGIAENVGHGEANFGDFSLALVGRERLAAVTTQDLRRVAREVFRESNRSTVVAVASPSSDTAAAGEAHG
jgi:predicted Zn-dependent peptidase